MHFNSSLNKLCLERRAAAKITSTDYTEACLIKRSAFCPPKRGTRGRRPKAQRQP